MKTTKELARDLGILRKKYAPSSLNIKNCNLAKQKAHLGQVFAYLVVLDFESTCWKDGKYRTQEIIEFPAVLCNTGTGQIESEFRYYVQPQEQPTLSDFCRELTGITQDQVEEGIPLSLCLRKFSQWLNQLKLDKNIAFHPADEETGAKAAFVTWSDWDLGVCLLYEARRKQLRIPPEMNCWIDLRATYRKFYSRKPHGLNGALEDVGITFEGREHSGLHDARNTARLAWRMMRDGCVMNITKNIATETARSSNLAVPLKRNRGQSTEDQRQGVCVEKSSPALTTAVHQTKLHSFMCTTNGKKRKSVSPSSAKNRRKSRGLSVRDSNRDDLQCAVVSKSHRGGIVESPVLTGTRDVSQSIISNRGDAKTRSLEKAKSDSTIPVWNPSKSIIAVSGMSVTHSKQSTVTGSFNVLNTPIRVVPLESPVGSSSSIHQGLNVGKSKCIFKTPSPVHVSRSPGYSSMTATPPMCKCGRRSKRRLVQSPGPNVGRFFFTCGVRTSQYDKNRGCDFFQWETEKSGGGNSSRCVSKTGKGGSLSRPYTPVVGGKAGLSLSQQRRSLGLRSAVPKFLR